MCRYLFQKYKLQANYIFSSSTLNDSIIFVSLLNMENNFPFVTFFNLISLRYVSQEQVFNYQTKIVLYHFCDLFTCYKVKTMGEHLSVVIASFFDRGCRSVRYS